VLAWAAVLWLVARLFRTGEAASGWRSERSRGSACSTSTSCSAQPYYPAGLYVPLLAAGAVVVERRFADRLTAR